MQKYKISNNQTSAKIGEETVLLDHNKGEYFSLNEIGTVLWESLQQSPKNFSELKETILMEYDVSAETVNTDLKDVIDDLMNHGLIEEDI
jgi:hypothetical protein